jgi:hypothetical protein
MASETMNNSIQTRGFARKTMQLEHSKIHDQRGYDVDIEFTLTGTASTYYHLETGQYNIHLKDFEIITDKNEVKAWLFIDSVVAKSSSPLAVTIFNSDHNSANVCSMNLYTNSVITSEGTTRKVYYIAGTTDVGQTANGSSNLADTWEFITKKNEDYLIKIQRIVADGNTKGNLRLRLYEETP